MIFLQLFYTFFLIGLFGFGGGYSMLSLIQQEVVVSHQWLTSAEFTNIVAISQMTPGPIGINSATYCGYSSVEKACLSDGCSHTVANLMGILGSGTSTFALVLPSFILMLLISKMFMKYMHHPIVQNILSGMRPAVVGLLLAATLMLCNSDNFSSPAVSPWNFWVSVFICIATFIGVAKMKVNPIRMIIYSAFAGLLLLY